MLDTILKLSVIVAVLAASASVGHYYLVYLPQRDARLDFERRSERERADAEKREAQAQAEAEREQVQAERKASERRQSAEKAEAKLSYDICLLAASKTHDDTWASYCQQLKDMDAKRYADCLKMTRKEVCDKGYEDRNLSSDCTLPRQIAETLNENLEKARDRCLQRWQPMR